MTFHTVVEAAPAQQKATIAVRKPRSLAVQVARKMLFWACLNTLILTGIGYVFVSERAEQRALAYLSGYVAQRVRAENQVFQASQANLDKFRARFLELYHDPKVLPNPDFDAYFEEKADGSIRLRKSFYTGTADAKGMSRDSMTGFIGRRRAPLTDELKRRLVLSYQLISELGPAWYGQLANLHATFPENAVIFYAPGVPWGLRAPADAYFPEMTIVGATLQANNPERKPVWSGLYFDEMAGKWNVTYEVPVDSGGKHLINPSHDIFLDELMARLINEHPTGGYNLILAKNGDLIAHPERLKEIRDANKAINVKTLGDPDLVKIHGLVSGSARSDGSPKPVRIIENEDLGIYVSFAEIKGPGWWFVTVYPQSVVLASARETANWLLAVGVTSFFLLTIVVVGVLRDRVSKPIGQMKLASEHVSGGDYVAVANGLVVLPEEQDNEIGLLARSFKSMARTVGESARHLERIVEERTLALRMANTELERLSLQDGLTGAFNRRSFDRDLSIAIYESVRGDAPYALMLCDIDYFKRYNDTYGHQAGDECLKAVIAEMARHLPLDRVYRYGGEEIAVIMYAADLNRCREIASSVVEAVARLARPHGESPHGIVTISAGLVALATAGETSPEAIRAADACLYRAKEKGRNRLEHALPEATSA